MAPIGSVGRSHSCGRAYERMHEHALAAVRANGSDKRETKRRSGGLACDCARARPAEKRGKEIETCGKYRRESTDRKKKAMRFPREILARSQPRSPRASLHPGPDHFPSAGRVGGLDLRGDGLVAAILD